MLRFMYYTYDVFENIAGELGETQIQKSNYLRIFDKLMNVYRSRGRCVGDWVDVPYTYWVKNFSNFKQYLEKLIEQEHITRDDSYSCGLGSMNGFSKRYKLNTGHLDKPVIQPVPEYWLKQGKVIRNSNVPDDMWNHIQSIEQGITCDLDQCELALIEKLDSTFLEEVIDQYRSIETSKGLHYHLNSFRKKLNPDETLVQSSDANDNVVSIIKKDQIEMEEKRLRYNRFSSCMNSLLSLHYPNNAYAIRDDGGRLYTKLTNLPSVFIRHLKLDNETLVEFDLANCQPLLLANEFESHGMIKLSSEGGYFYKWLWLHTDVDLPVKFVKRNFLSMMFSKRNNTPIADRIFEIIKEDQPEFADRFKKKRGKELSLLLRRRESKLFIDTIYREIVKRDLPAFTRHDGIIAAQSKCDEVESIIKESMESFSIKGEVRLNTFDGRII